jgi:hypothetical protein
VEAAEREAAILELSIMLNDARLRARRVAEELPEALPVVEAIQHADDLLDMAWELHDGATYGDG